jgi:hypothetical protein
MVGLALLSTQKESVKQAFLGMQDNMAAPQITNGWHTHVKEIERIPSNPDSVLRMTEKPVRTGTGVRYLTGVLIGMARAEYHQPS